ncbi:hypothetical protein [Geomonas ferrireducens]|uniref:hypothetical protein n=1 Tax=Geomonas ferrireducens TaxID=2570227 RepID=UPI001FEC16F9|nr:hypothetical protein [Geomonas ferrireducens]
MLTLYLYVLQNQWLVMTLLCGVALVIATALVYQALWLPRGTEKKSEEIKVRGPASFLAWLRSFMPWIIILLFLACIAFTFFEISYNAGTPPNW